MVKDLTVLLMTPFVIADAWAKMCRDAYADAAKLLP